MSDHAAQVLREIALRTGRDPATLKRYEDALDAFRISLRTPPKFDGSALKKIAGGLRMKANEYIGKSGVLTADQLTCMELLCEAVKAGAFAGQDWLLWNKSLIQEPNIANASVLLGKYQPEGWNAWRFYSETDNFDTYLRFLAEQIERFINVDVKPSSAATSIPVADEPKSVIPLPLTNLQRFVFEIIKSQIPGQTISGKRIIEILWSDHKVTSSEQTLTTHIIPVLKPLGVKSKRKRGYWFESPPK